MKTFALALSLLLPTIGMARCLVEILDNDDDPVGYSYEGRTCPIPLSTCEAQLSRLNRSDARCEITMDVGGDVIEDIEQSSSNNKIITP